jgi:mRNA-degrading endonuclease RelE of RelBE toxin-antitoxin system
MHVKLSRQAAEFIGSQPPEPRRRLRQALKNLSQGKGDLQALTEPLQGYHRCRVGSYRIVFRYEAGQFIYVPLIEQRLVVYQVLAELLKAQLGGSRSDWDANP